MSYVLLYTFPFVLVFSFLVGWLSWSFGRGNRGWYRWLLLILSGLVTIFLIPASNNGLVFFTSFGGYALLWFLGMRWEQYAQRWKRLLLMLAAGGLFTCTAVFVAFS